MTSPGEGVLISASDALNGNLAKRSTGSAVRLPEETSQRPHGL